MEYVRLMFLLLTAVCILFLLAGLFKPWAMLWWEDVQNRRKVILVYGSLAILFISVYLVLKLF